MSMVFWTAGTREKLVGVATEASYMCMVFWTAGTRGAAGWVWLLVAR